MPVAGQILEAGGLCDRRNKFLRVLTVERNHDIDFLSRRDSGLGRLRDRLAVAHDLDFHGVVALIPLPDRRGDEAALGAGNRHELILRVDLRVLGDLHVQVRDSRDGCGDGGGGVRGGIVAAAGAVRAPRAAAGTVRAAAGTVRAAAGAVRAAAGTVRDPRAAAGAVRAVAGKETAYGAVRAAAGTMRAPRAATGAMRAPRVCQGRLSPAKGECQRAQRSHREGRPMKFPHKQSPLSWRYHLMKRTHPIPTGHVRACRRPVPRTATLFSDPVLAKRLPVPVPPTARKELEHVAMP